MQKISGKIQLPGDKSISHRAALFSALKDGKSIFTNFNFNEDCTSTLTCLAEMGINWKREENRLEIEGINPAKWKRPQNRLDAGNSGTTTRLLSAILAGLPFPVTIFGDNSLSKRPMKRIIDPLSLMGAKITSNNGYLPLSFEAVEKLKAIRYKMPVASAQVKSAVLLAGLFAEGITEVVESKQSRDHTERMLKLQKRENKDGTYSLFSSKETVIPDLSMSIPGDISSAAFFISAALLIPDSELVIENISLNPSRTGILDVLLQMGAHIEIEQTEEFPEPVGNLIIKYSKLNNIEIPIDVVPNIIDEIPILAILASRSAGVFRITGAEELRYKESDRIKAMVDNLRQTGIAAEELPDGLQINGPQQFKGGQVKTYMDHRIAMSFAIANLISDGEIKLDFPDCVNVSFPSFWNILQSILR